MNTAEDLLGKVLNEQPDFESRECLTMISGYENLLVDKINIVNYLMTAPETAHCRLHKQDVILSRQATLMLRAFPQVLEQVARLHAQDSTHNYYEKRNNGTETC